MLRAAEASILLSLPCAALLQQLLLACVATVQHPWLHGRPELDLLALLLCSLLQLFDLTACIFSWAVMRAQLM